MAFDTRKKTSLIFGIVLIILGLLSFYDFSIINANNYPAYLSILFLSYGAVATYFNFGNADSIKVFISTSIFLTGVVFFSWSFFEILEIEKLIIVSFIFIPGAAIFISHFSQPSGKKLAYYSITWWVTSFMIYQITPGVVLAEYLVGLVNFFLPFIPVLIILYGVMLLRK